MEKYKDSKFIFVVGIGGSDLASKAVWNAMTLHKTDRDETASSAGKKIFFLEAPDQREYEEIKNIVENEIKNLEEMVLLAISKSGQTTETLETFKKTYEILAEKFGPNTNQRAIIISSAGSPLWQIAEEKNIEKIAWQGDIGGRFSAFTVAHTTVLQIAGLDIKKFVEGSQSKEMEKCIDLAENIFQNYKKGADILDFFIFNSELEDLGKWCRQLIAESLSTLTPTVSLGPTDLHSMLELYLGGPKNRFTIFIKSAKEIDGKPNETAYENVTEAYQKAGLPFEKYEIPEINEKELGKFMAFMIETTLDLAKHLGEDPFDQPAVERYKAEIRSTKPETN